MGVERMTCCGALTHVYASGPRKHKDDCPVINKPSEDVLAHWLIGREPAVSEHAWRVWDNWITSTNQERADVIALIPTPERTS